MKVILKGSVPFPFLFNIIISAVLAPQIGIFFLDASGLCRRVEPRYIQGPRDWQNVFAITTFRYIEVLFHIFYYSWGFKK